MKNIINTRMTVELESDEVVVFLLGMKVNRWWKVWSWLPTALALKRMLRELDDRPDSGLVATIAGGPNVMVQYWRSFNALIEYATDQSGEHYPAWAAFNKSLKDNGDVGIWHETYVVPSSNIECIYNHMPRWGLGNVGELVPAIGHKKSARSRMGRPETRAIST